MRMKTVYFVRHGESEGNVENISQGPDSKLTDKGKEQALFIADRCTRLSIDRVVSSTFERARHTAEMISERTGSPHDTSELFIERRKPSEQRGRPKDDPEAARIERVIGENFHIPEYRFSDEENFEDLKDRARRAFEFLEEQKENSIVVVTHGYFIRVLGAYLLFGDELTAQECRSAVAAFRITNTGLTVAEYDEEKEPQWRLVTWNDHAHLG